MSRVSSFVFIDLETSGLPEEEHNKTKITEISMVAVKRSHLLETRAGASPRVIHKVTLCLNPGRLITDDATRITGLSNDLLEHESYFDNNVFNTLNTFLQLLTPPVCLIAHSGFRFDYPVLKAHLEKLQVSFSADLLCADSFYGFYNIMNNSKIYCFSENKDSENGVQEQIQNGGPETQSGVKTKKQNSEDIPSISNTTIDDPIEIPDAFYSTNIAMKAVNERTPKSNKTMVQRKPVGTARRRLPWGDGPKPTESYKLTDIYQRVLNKPVVDAHRAENDCIFTLEISVALAKSFVEWVDNNSIKFSDIEPMRLGVPL